MGGAALKKSMAPCTPNSEMRGRMVLQREVQAQAVARGHSLVNTRSREQFVILRHKQGEGGELRSVVLAGWPCHSSGLLQVLPDQN